MKFRKWISISLGAALLMSILNGCGASQTTPNHDSAADKGGIRSAAPASPSGSNAASLRTPAALDLTGATIITLSGSTVSIEGSGAEAEGGVVTITEGGIYAVSGTLDDGRIIVNAGSADVTVALNGASIVCSYGSPLYIYQAGTATVHLMEGTENTLTDGESYTFSDSLSSAADEEPNACLYSKEDLVIEGAGALAVEANYNNGITSKDSLEIYDGAVTVDAANHGVNGKDSNTIDSAILTVTCGGDAVRSTNDSDETLGWVSVSNSTLTLTAGEDGIQAETSAVVSAGTYAITSGGGSTVTPGDDVSAKGIKTGTDLTLSSGIYTLDCSDDAIHANGNVTITGGSYTISTGDDAAHADGDLTVSGGTLDIQASYEGLEGGTVTVSGGDITAVSSDDALNAAGGNDGSGFGGHGMGNTFTPGGNSSAITITDGTIQMLAGGDGLDSNGSIEMTGGTVVVCSTGGGDGALDYESSFTLDGGILFAASAGNMAANPSSPNQPALSVGFGQTLEAGTYVQFKGDAYDFVFRLTGQASSAVFSAPELEGGAVCTVSYGGTYSGESARGLCSGGSYSGGTVLAELTLETGLTSYGQTGGMGGRGDMIGRGDRPEGPSGNGMTPGGDFSTGGAGGGEPGEAGASGGGNPPSGGPGGEAPSGGTPPEGDAPGESGTEQGS